MVKKNNILAEAALNYNKTLNKYSNGIKEMMKHDCFKDAKRFEAIEEVNLFESLTSSGDEEMDEVGMGPSFSPLKHLDTGGVPPGPGQYGEATKPLGKLRDAIKNAQMDSFASVNELAEKLETVVAATEEVLPLLDSESPVVQKETKILLAKVYLSLANMFKVVTEKAKELRQKLIPSGFDVEEARMLMKNANVSSAAADAEVTAGASKEKPGFFKGIMNRLTNSRD